MSNRYGQCVYMQVFKRDEAGCFDLLDISRPSSLCYRAGWPLFYSKKTPIGVIFTFFCPSFDQYRDLLVKKPSVMEKVCKSRLFYSYLDLYIFDLYCNKFILRLLCAYSVVFLRELYLAGFVCL